MLNVVRQALLRFDPAHRPEAIEGQHLSHCIPAEDVDPFAHMGFSPAVNQRRSRGAAPLRHA